MAINQSPVNTVSSLNGNFKDIYADKLINLVPDNVVLMNLCKFSPAGKELGNLYKQPVIVGHEHGLSYTGASGDAATLNDAISGQVKEASVQGYEFILRSQLTYAAAARAASSKAAFERSTKLVVANMIRSFAKRLEACLFYGQKELATVASVASNVVTITTADWAPGLWIGAEGGTIQIYDVTLATLRDTREIDGVSLENRTLTLDAAPAGVVATDRIFWKGAKGNEFKGLHSIMTESSSLFGINPSAYSVFKSTEYSASGADLSMNKIMQAISRGAEKGLDEDVVCLINPRTWAKLLTEQSALRMYDSSYKSSEAENGAQSLKFHAQNGVVEIRACSYVKESLAFILPPKEMMRVGSTDITFRLPGREQQDEFFLEMPSTNGFELRAYTDQALFTASPNKLVLITNIINS